MAKIEDENKPSAPYGSFKTFESFIESLSETVVPPTIDRSVMAKLSGAAKGSLIPALKFLGLTDKDGTTQPALKALVKAYGKPEWAEAMKPVAAAYSGVLKGLDVRSGTAAQLKSTFSLNSGLDGQLLVKAIRFWLNVMAAANNPISPHFKAPSMPPGSNGARARSSKPSGGRAAGGGGPRSRHEQKPQDHQTSTVPDGYVAFPIGAPPRSIWVPGNLTDSECDTIKAMDALLRAFVKSQKGGVR